MPHGTMKPRNKHGHAVLMSKRSERHEDKSGRGMKRARVREQNEREIQEELDDWDDRYDGYEYT